MLLSIEFLSDDKFLQNYTTDWNDGGTRYTKPEWTSANKYPVSHTMNDSVKIRVKIKVSPSDACPETGKLRGKGPHGLVFEKAGFKVKPGIHNVILDHPQFMIQILSRNSF